MNTEMNGYYFSLSRQTCDAVGSGLINCNYLRGLFDYSASTSLVSLTQDRLDVYTYIHFACGQFKSSACHQGGYSLA